MKITYDDREEIYFITLGENEGVFMFHTNDIVEARKEFIECATRLFNDAVCKKLRNKGE